MKTLSLHQPLQSILWTDKFSPTVRGVILALVGSMLITLGAHVNIPMEPVPVTLQTLAVLFIGMTFGWRLGLAAVLLYLGEGAVGLPVFANGLGGFPIILGTTGGYLLSYIPAVVLCGFLAERGWGKNALGVLCAGFLSSGLILIMGGAVLALFFGWSRAFTLGVLPFLFGDALKVIYLAFVVPAFWKNRA